MKRGVASVFGLLGVLGALAASAGQGQIQVERGLVYGKGGGMDLQLDLAIPKGEGPFPAVVCIHGGGWRAGNRQELAKVIEALAQQGFVAATVSYRLAPQHRFPAQIEDCKAAVRWLRANAKKYKVDPDRIGALGLSAGGHLACLLGTASEKAGLEGNGGNAGVSSRVQAVVSFFGPTDLTDRTWSKEIETTLIVPFLGGKLEEKRDLYKLCSPLSHATKDAPPFLFFHGDRDPLVGIHHSQKLVKKLKDLGVSARLVTMQGEGHGWVGVKLLTTVAQTLEFLKEKLKK